MRTPLSILGVAMLLVSIHVKAQACTCDLPFGRQTAKQQLNKARSQAHAIFVGKVIEIVSKPEDHFVLVRFEVERSWKGNLGKEVSVFTGRGGGDCGYPFEQGETYLVYASGDTKELSTNICQRTAPLSPDGDVRVLGKPRPLVEK